MLNNKVTKAVRLAIAFGAVSTAAFSASTLAAEEGAEKVERIEVTGSRIKRADMEGASPVTSIGRVQIESSGVQSVGELLQTVAQADLSGLTQLTNNTNANDGSQTISLRNLGDNRTLVLVDGRRFLALGGGQVDITSGKFVFSASEAYLIENGKITQPIKGATLIGNGPEVMQQISMVGNDLALDKGVGVCGKDGQSVPVGVGQPSLKIDLLTVGGTA